MDFCLVLTRTTGGALHGSRVSAVDDAGLPIDCRLNDQEFKVAARAYRIVPSTH
jgi:hypothetical protein